MKRMYLIGGPPGIGKTTLAHLLCKHFGGVYREADMFFTDDEGNYQWDPAKIKEAHEWCQREVEEWLIAECECVAVSNTFTQEWERTPYVNMAAKYGYEVIFIPMIPVGDVLTSDALAKYNIHGVPVETVHKMMERMKRNVSHN